MRTVRPITDEVKQRFAKWVQTESWEEVFNGGTSTKMAERFHSLVHSKIEQLCPTKTIKVSALNNGKPRFPTVEKLVRQKKILYNMKGNCPKYKDFKKQIKEKLKDEGQKFVVKQIELAKQKGGGWQKKGK